MPTRHFIDRNKTRYSGSTPLEVARKIANNNHREIFSIRETTRDSDKNLYYYEVINDNEVRSVTREYKQKIRGKLVTLFSNFDNDLYAASQTVIMSKKDLVDLKEFLHHKNTKYRLYQEWENGMVITHKNMMLNIIGE
jgi:hypothetical protein